jgi:hypothetical protein
MREITKPDGEVYCWVDIADSLIKIKLNTGSAKGYRVVLDEKIIPQLIEILQEAQNGQSN